MIVHTLTVSSLCMYHTCTIIILCNSQRKRESCEHLALEVRITLNTLSGYTYNCTEEHQDILIDLHDNLQKLTEEFKSKLPQQDGLLLRPQVRKQLKLSLQKKVSKGTKPLPHPSKRGRKKQSSDYRNRVGRKSQSLRKVKFTCACIICMITLPNEITNTY